MSEVEMRDALDAAAHAFDLVAEVMTQWAQPTYQNEVPQGAATGLAEYAGLMAARCAEASRRR